MQGKSIALGRPFRLSEIRASAAWLGAAAGAFVFIAAIAAIGYALLVLHSMNAGLAEMNAKLSQTNRLLAATNDKLSVTNSRLLVSVELAGTGGQRLSVTNAQLEQMRASLASTNAQLDQMRHGLAAMENDFRRASTTISHSTLLHL